VRPFAEADIPRVAELHRRVFRGNAADDESLDAYRRYFSEVFLTGAVTRCAPGSLVYEREGRVLGFLGIMPRRVVFNGRPMLMAVCSQFVVDPAGRGQVGLQLLKECFEGRQDLTISDEAGDSTRKIWEWCGGETVLSYSMQWTRPLRPAQLGLSMLASRSSLPFVARAVAPLGPVLDAVARRLAPGLFRIGSPGGSRDELDIATFLTCLRGLEQRSALAPAHDARSAAWTLDRAGRRPGYSALRKLLVRDRHDEIDGWFLYCIGTDGTAEVLQISARAGAVGHVLDHLFADALERGAVAVSGRLEPALVAALPDKRALFHRGSCWTLLHSRNADVRHALHRGDTFLSRLEGEWCLRFP
jgi:hypothetical protein